MNKLKIENLAEIMNISFDRRARKYGKEVALEWVNQEGLFPKQVQPTYKWNPFSEFFEVA